MSVIVTTVVGLVIWIVLWSIGVKAIDGIIITLVMVLGAMSARLLGAALPGNREG